LRGKRQAVNDAQMSSTPSNNTAAIGWMMTAMVILGIVDNLVPYIVDDISLWQFHTLRSIVAVATVALLGLVFGLNLRPKRLWAVLGRSLFLAIAMILYFGCLGFFPISAAAAGLFTAPVWWCSSRLFGHARPSVLCGW